jgi:RNA polymerase sigma-70 factor (ECF subfamily)
MADHPAQSSGASPIVELVQEHHETIYRYTYRLCGNASDAEDLTQQTFLIAHQKFDQLREPDKARGWLCTVARRCFLKSVRRKRPTAASSLEMNLDFLPDEPTEEPIDRQALQLALDELPDEFRLVLVMFYFEFCTYQEIAEKLELPVGTVMSRLSRAKGHLRRRLAPGEIETVGKEAHNDTDPSR